MVEKQGRLARLISREMRRRKWSQGQLAAKVGCSQPVISALLSGKTANPKTAVLQGVASAFGWNLGQLVDMGYSQPDRHGEKALSEAAFFSHLETIQRRLATLETSPEELATPLARASEMGSLGRAVAKAQAAVDQMSPILEDLRRRVEAIEMRGEAPHKPRRKAV